MRFAEKEGEGVQGESSDQQAYACQEKETLSERETSNEHLVGEGTSNWPIVPPKHISIPTKGRDVPLDKGHTPKRKKQPHERTLKRGLTC